MPIAELRAQTKLAVEVGPTGITFVDPTRAYVTNHDTGTVSIVDVPNAR